MPTAFKQVKNNAFSLIATAPSPATSGTSLVVTSGEGARFPQPGNGFWATIWNATSFPNPNDDPNREIVLVTARSTDTFTITRAQLTTSARTVVVGDAIRLLVQDQQFNDIQSAINNLENTYARFSGAQVWNTAGITLNNGAYTNITFDSEYWDTESFHSTTTNTGRLTVPRAGYYRIGGYFELQTWSATATRFITVLYKNGVSLRDIIDQDMLASGEPGINWSILLYLATNDFVNLDIYQGSGANRVLNNTSWFNIELVGV